MRKIPTTAPEFSHSKWFKKGGKSIAPHANLKLGTITGAGKNCGVS
jgi:hypothetical protein